MSSRPPSSGPSARPPPRPGRTPRTDLPTRDLQIPIPGRLEQVMMWTGGPQSGAVEPVTDVKAAAADFNWLLNRFATETAGVVDVIGVSSDGLLIAVSQLRGQADSERLAAIVSGITSLAM